MVPWEEAAWFELGPGQSSAWLVFVDVVDLGAWAVASNRGGGSVFARVVLAIHASAVGCCFVAMCFL